MCHGGCPLEDGALKTAIEAKWGSYDAFIKELSAKTVSFFGSGWSWLVKKADGSLDIVCTSNAGNPMRGRCCREWMTPRRNEASAVLRCVGARVLHRLQKRPRQLLQQ